jgi:hypothetical protein
VSAILLSLLLTGPGQPVSDVELLERADHAFTEGCRLREQGGPAVPHFQKAAAALEELRRRGRHNALLYRNLGNACWLSGDLPRAILAYRLGLRLSPDDRALQDLLTSAREQVVYPTGSTLGRPADQVRPPWLPLPGKGGLFALGLLGYSLGCLSLMRWWMRSDGRFLVLGLLLVGLGLTAGWAVWRQQRAGDHRPIAVLAQDRVLLRKGDALTFPPWDETAMNRGVEAEVLLSRNGWLQIELPGGEVGWVSAEEVVTSEEFTPPP